MNSTYLHLLRSGRFERIESIEYIQRSRGMSGPAADLRGAATNGAVMTGGTVGAAVLIDCAVFVVKGIVNGQQSIQNISLCNPTGN